MHCPHHRIGHFDNQPKELQPCNSGLSISRRSVGWWRGHPPCAAGHRRRRLPLPTAGLGHPRARPRRAREADLAAVRKVAEEDVTRFGEELQRLDTEVLTTSLDEATRQDYQRALDAYETAKESLGRSPGPRTITHVTQQLEDGRYAAACVLARARAEPLPTRRRRPASSTPPTGPATDRRRVGAARAGSPARSRCALADAERVAPGRSRTSARCARATRWCRTSRAVRRTAPTPTGYFGGYAMSGLFPGFLLGSMMTGWWGPGIGYGGDDWSGDGGDGGRRRRRVRRRVGRRLR